MRSMILLLVAAMFAAPAFAKILKSQPTPKAAQVKGNTEIKADQKTATAVGVGDGNTATNTVGAIKSGSKIQGNTSINASQSNATSIAVGNNNTAANEAGVIGGK